MIEAFEGNKVETITFLPSLRAFQEALQFPEVTVAAETGPGIDGGGGYRHALGMVNCAPYRGPDYGSSSARRSPMCPMRWLNGWPSILIRIRPMGWC